MDSIICKRCVMDSSDKAIYFPKLSTVLSIRPSGGFDAQRKEHYIRAAMPPSSF